MPRYERDRDERAAAHALPVLAAAPPTRAAQPLVSASTTDRDRDQCSVGARRSVRLPDRRTATLNDWGICPGRGIPGTGQWTRGRRPARRDGADTAGGLNSGRSVRAPCVGQPHPVVDGGRPDCPRSAGRQRRTGPSAPRFGGAKDQRRTAPPRSCSAGAAVPGWAGRSRCPGTAAAVGAAGEAGTAPGHDAAAPGYGSPTPASRCSPLVPCPRVLPGGRLKVLGGHPRLGQHDPAAVVDGVHDPTEPPAVTPSPLGQQAWPPTRVARQAAHPAVPGTRGPLAADPGQRRPLGQRQAVALGSHPAGHRPSMTANRTVVRGPEAGRCCTQRRSEVRLDGLARPTASAALNGAVRPALSLVDPVPPDCSSGSAAQLSARHRQVVPDGPSACAKRLARSAGPARSAWAARSCWPNVSSSSTASGWARTSRFPQPRRSRRPAQSRQGSSQRSIAPVPRRPGARRFRSARALGRVPHLLRLRQGRGTG